MSCFFFSFYSPYVILLKIVLLIPLKYHTGNRNCRLLWLILLRLNIEVHIFHCSRGGRLAALVGVCIVWNLEPLASSGQSGHKLIPHIICQFLCTREKKTLNEDLFYKGSSANLPRLHTCENKVPLWDFKEFAVTLCIITGVSQKWEIAITMSLLTPLKKSSWTRISF